MKVTITVIVLAAVLCAGHLSAQPPQSEIENHYLLFESSAIEAFRNPTEGVTFSLDQRSGFVYGENIMRLDRSRTKNTNYWQYSRNRTRLGATFNVAEDVDINARIVWEWWAYDKPSTMPDETNWSELIFDRLNVTVRNVFDEPLTVVIGRQDITLGNGWLIKEGSPGDGTRSFYFDAVRATYKPTDTKTIDLIYIHNYDDSNQWLHPIGHDQSQSLMNGYDQRAAILYFTDRIYESTQLEYYYIYKEEKESQHFKDMSNGMLNNDNKEIHTVGVAVEHQFDESWSCRLEAAKQFGNAFGNEVKGWGANSRVLYAFNDDNQNTVHVDYEFMSGDDNTSDSSVRTFDPLWGTWPQDTRGGELQYYLWGPETGLGVVTNLHRIGLGHSFQPAEKWTLETSYNPMWADEMGNTAGRGRFRGHLLTEYIKYRCCDRLTAHILFEYFIPGSYYPKSGNDPALFARFNFDYIF